MSTIQTVTGPIDTGDLGPTSVHEHLLIDLGVWFDEPADPEAARIAALPVSPETEAIVRVNPFAVRANLVLDSSPLATVASGITRLDQPPVLIECGSSSRPGTISPSLNRGRLASVIAISVVATLPPGARARHRHGSLSGTPRPDPGGTR